MRIFLSTAIVIFSAFATLPLLWTNTAIAVPTFLLAEQSSSHSEQEALTETEKMTEKNAGYYQLMTNAKRALNREEAVRSYKLAKSRVLIMEGASESKKLELIQAAEDGLRNVDKINFKQNREKLADYYERTAVGFRNEGRENVAKKLQRRADRIRSGEAKSQYDE